MNRNIKDALYGVIGGIAGTFVIGQAMRAFKKLQSEEEKQLKEALVQEPPTEKLASLVSEKALGVQLDKEKKAATGQVVLWTYGAFLGGVYGLLRKRVPAISWGAG